MAPQEESFPKVFTEGKTDWKHIKSANEKLRICPILSFHETEEPLGDQNLLKMCESFARVMQRSPQIFVFDNDNKEIAKKVSLPQSYYKAWGNNVYSLCLPAPPFRSGFQSICVELLYKDEDIMISSPDNRRLFLSSEFDERSGNHKTVPLIHVSNALRIRGATKRSTTIIVDSDIGVFDSENNNLTISKADFAEFILNKVGPFDSIDFRGFRQLLAVIKGIVDKSKASFTEVLTSERGNHGSQRITIRQLSRRDHPPHTPVFVGREAQIKKLDDPNVRVAAITGLGGEGKSSIASRFFKMAQDGKTNLRFSTFGWCDCKELETTFHDRLLILLEEISDGKETREKYSDENISDTIARFIEHLVKQECLVIFDNVDAFVDHDSFSLIDSVKTLFENITEQLTRGLVVFTCRAPIHDFHPSFLEISTLGLSFSESQDLAAQFNIRFSEQQLRTIYDTTKGHALWLNLIFGQIRSGRITPDKIQSVMTSNSQISVDLDVRLLRSIWNTLDQKEKEIIWVISAFARPKPIEYIERASGISYKKCLKIVHNLVSLRLVVEIDSEGITLFDLHPIIRTKAKEECGGTRSRSLSARVITILIPSGIPGLALLIKSNDFSRSSVENYIESVEIALEAGDTHTSIKYLKELSDNLWKIGEETKFVDLCKRLFSAVDDSRFKIGIDSNLTDVFKSFVNALLMQGDYEIADKYLTKLQTSMQSIKQFIFYVEMKGYFLWFKNDFQKAAILLRDGIEDIRKKKEEVPRDIRYNLALALRDSGKVDEAINIFLDGRDLAVLEDLQVGSTEASATDLGNLGRCYFLKHEFDRALRLVQKSLGLLEKGEARLDKVNQGYAHLWISDILVERGSFVEAWSHLSSAVKIWQEFAPARLKKARKHVLEYPKKFLTRYTNEEIMRTLEIANSSKIRRFLRVIRHWLARG
jgi:tetratricopeptide (TPR) repeat protein